MKRNIWYIILVVVMCAGCEMDEPVVTSTDKKAIFGSEEGLKAYSMSYCLMLLISLLLSNRWWIMGLLIPLVDLH